jgi:hypothetical protein
MTFWPQPIASIHREVRLGLGTSGSWHPGAALDLVSFGHDLLFENRRQHDGGCPCVLQPVQVVQIGPQRRCRGHQRIA